MRPWTIWMIRHRMAWLLKSIVWVTYPLHILAYWSDALEDVGYTIRNIKREQGKLK